MATVTEAAAAVPESEMIGRAAEIVAQALRAGASDAEVILREGDEFEAQVRMGELETLKNSGSRGVGLRIFLEGAGGTQVASTSSSDLSSKGIGHLVSGALQLARMSSPDPNRALPEAEELGRIEGDMGLYFDDVYSMPVPERIEYARRVEAAALTADTRIHNSDGGNFDAATSHRILANSRGFRASYRSSYCSISTSPLAAGTAGEMQRDYWYSSARSISKLDTPESVGAEAARRTVRRLDGRKVATQQVPIVFAPEIARSIIGAMAEAANGDSIYRGASFFSGKLGEQVADSSITIIDDGTLPGLFGSSPFDGEGLPTRRTVLVENGILKNYLLNTYYARKLGLKSTASAVRGLSGNPGIGTHNLYLPAGDKSPQEILAAIPAGLYITELLGRGVNMVTGDYSRGASGLWISGGELTFPVQEVTIAGNLKDMFRNISGIGNDLAFRSSTACPTLRIDGMIIAGA
jgi:PmbA protein